MKANKSITDAPGRGLHQPGTRLSNVRGLAICLMWFVAARGWAEPVQPPVDFDREIRPILSDTCFTCHGPDAEARQAELRLDTKEGLLDYVVVPGEPDDSELLLRITSDDDDYKMPPPASHRTLSAQDKELFRRWISEGAEITEHWSFRPLPAKVELPQVGDDAWPRETLDRFVLARLITEGLAPSRQAEPLRLLRRVTLDLTGLPPTVAEIEEFQSAVAARGLDAALEQAVDRLLACPAYGEHMAVAWLDAVRYADSFGYQADQLNTQWPYRDWVVRALNSNMPYDQFLTWQLAGDLLDNPTPDQILATAFNRIHRMTSEGGSIAEEWLVENASDRVHTFGTVFLGLTLECTRCHDHKYDPITMRDYYSLSAFFNSIDENGMYDHAEKVPAPSLLLPTEAQQAKLAAALQKTTEAEAGLAAATADGQQRFDDWLASSPTVAHSPDMTGHFDFEGKLDKITNKLPSESEKDLATAVRHVKGVDRRAVRFDGDHGLALPKVFQVDRWDPFTVDFWIRDPVRNSLPVVLLQRSFGTDVGYNGFDVTLADGVIEVKLYRIWPGNGIGIRATEPIAKDDWQHLAVTYDGSSSAGGLQLFVGGKKVPTEVLRDRMRKSTMHRSHGTGMLTLGERFRDRGFKDGEIDELRVYTRALTPLEVQDLHDGEALAAALADASAQREALRAYYFSAIDEPARKQADELRTARFELVYAEDEVHEVSVMEEMAEPRSTYILARGAYDAPKSDETLVHRDVFEHILPPFPDDAPRDRLGLAQWLTDPNHPLTSRVFLNRMWADFFGHGLVTTPENFGRQGAAPTHPELLDWLARDFIDHGWDIKRMCRQIVLSATYRQDSRAGAKLRERDPENDLVARGPSHRLSAEQIRDVALASSGLLDDRLAGPPVSPYQPGEDLWREANQMSPPYHQSVGKDLHRRSLYSVWKRTVPLPNMLAFDAPTREVCVVSRSRTNTPLQALVLLNDVQFIEAARTLATEVSHLHKEERQQIGEAFVRLTGRPPDADELDLLEEVYDHQYELFSTSGEQDAFEFLQIGETKPDATVAPAELAALTTTCQVILSLDATVYER
jgi:hypothetical protein